ncbi:hypothetical protein BAY60_23735 [Prauserella muralis]|uniref:Uncharacterized protein n=2 Tax=Prauserella muralis TaxID=588067 RepID=A0A2V4ATZ7_9PSEU|nr:hypothetical protein BAY60_23735 [Prauserella muralis]
MSSPHTSTNPSVSTVLEPSRHPLRLQLKAEAPTTGYVDGAWWPRSRDLGVELPGLLAKLTVRPGRIERVTYNSTSWEPAGRRLTFEGRAIRLEGFRSQHPDTVTVTGQGRQRLTLLVIPPGARVEAAQHALTTASKRANVDSTEVLLAHNRVAQVAPPEGPGPEGMDAATHRWEIEGGRIQ